MRFYSLFLVFILAGCAEMYLEAQVRKIEGRNRQLNDFNDMRNLACPAGGRCSLSGATALAFNQADAYARAARQAQVSQDIASGALILAAGATVLGAVEGVADPILVKRGIGAIAVQQVGSRAVPQAAVRALYEGSSRMNCIALSGSLYEEFDLDDYTPGGPGNSIPVQFASFVMILAMREVEYRTLFGISRQIGDFSALVSAFSGAISGVDQIPDVSEPSKESEGAAGDETSGFDTTAEIGSGTSERKTVTVIRQNAALERFFSVLAGCLAAEEPKPTVSAK